MFKFVMSSILILLVLSFFTLGIIAQDSQPKYIGVKNCKMCHISKKSGEAYNIWAASAHAKAYQTLATPEAKEIAKKNDIEDPQKSEKCLKCHVTGYGQPAADFEKSYSMEEGVTCEACHGPGSEYNSIKVMKQITAGEVDGAKFGLVIPDAALCKKCHNEESPTFKGFDFEKFATQIAHPIPGEK